MPTLTVKTTPVMGYVKIYRVSGRYGIMNEGRAPVSWTREYPWDFLAEAEPVVLDGKLWMPEVPQIRGICERSCSVTLRYMSMGPAEEWF